MESGSANLGGGSERGLEASLDVQARCSRSGLRVEPHGRPGLFVGLRQQGHVPGPAPDEARPGGRARQTHSQGQVGQRVSGPRHRIVGQNLQVLGHARPDRTGQCRSS